MAMAKNKIQRLVFSRVIQKLIVNLGEMHKLAKHEIGVPVQVIIEQIMYAVDDSTLEEIHKSGARGEWHLSTDCVAS